MNWSAVEAAYADPRSPLHSPVTNPQEMTPWRQAQAFVNTRQGIPEHASLTTSGEGHRKYCREVKRMASAAKAAAKAAWRREHGVPDPVVDIYKVKLCLRCQQHLPVSRFANPRVRICERCDGPPLFVGPGAPVSRPGQE
jgi:hypothetical protein